MNENQASAFLGIFTHTEPIFTMDDQLISLEQCLNDNEWIRGVQLRIPWKNLQPARDTVHWDKLERQIEAAASRGKLVHVSIIPGIHTPDWVFDQGAAKTGPVTIGGTQAHTPILWDPVYMDAFTRLLTQLAGRYRNDARVTAMHVLGHHYKGDEMHAPKETGLLEPYGFSRQTVLDNWRYWLDLYGSLFPSTRLILVISQMYPGFNDLAQEVAELFVGKFPGRAILQSDQLHGRQDALGQPEGKAQLSDSIIRSLSGSAPHGHEMVGSFKEQPQRQGSVEMTIYNFVRMGNPLYLQLWRRDCSDPSYAEALLRAWEKYGGMKPDALRSRLQEEGLYVETSDWNPEQFFKTYKRVNPEPPSK
jgi:hypothetical protein